MPDPSIQLFQTFLVWVSRKEHPATKNGLISIWIQLRPRPFEHFTDIVFQLLMLVDAIRSLGFVPRQAIPELPLPRTRHRAFAHADRELERVRQNRVMLAMTRTPARWLLT